MREATLPLTIIASIIIIPTLVIWAFLRPANPIKRYHGITLSSSAIIRDHKRSPGWPDYSAISMVDIDVAEVKDIVSQLTLDPEFAARWPNYTPPSGTSETYFCESTTGDFLIVNVGRTRDERVSVWFHTDWN